MLVGSFNPTIFHPEWFLRQNLLPQTEVEAAKISVIVPQVCDFQTERFHIQVTTERFLALSNAVTNPATLKDLVLGTFFVLEHTPGRALGLNRQMHFPLASEELWHRVGDRLAPKDGWKGILKHRPGMRSLTIEAAGEDGTKITVKVEPSPQLKFGVYFDTNEHYQAPKNAPMKTLMDIVRERWEDAYNYAAEIADHVNWAIV